MATNKGLLCKFIYKWTSWKYWCAI